jgi:hypothetical protein
MNRIANAVTKMEKQIADRIAAQLTTKAGVKKAGKDLDMDFVEFVKFQELKSLAFASGTLTQEEAQYIYALLGETPTHFNKQSVAAKAVLTSIFKELLEARMA